jgi:hypothetical protein
MIIFSLYVEIRRVSLSPPTKKVVEKLKKIKFDIKIDFLKNDHLRIKKNEGQK